MTTILLALVASLLFALSTVLQQRIAMRASDKAALVGTAAGILFALHGVITKGFTENFDQGLVALLGDWTLWAVLIVAAISMAVSQIALQAGDLAPAIASESVVDPLVSVVIGVGLFQEAIHSSATGHLASLAALAAMLASVGFLAGREGRRTPI